MSVDDDLKPLDPAYVADILSKAPFVTIDGVINVRDLGAYPSVSNPGHVTKSGFIYRSAELSSITESGKAMENPHRRSQMKERNISKVFDLRSDTEIRKYNSAQSPIDGVEILHTPVFQVEDYSPEMMAKRFQLYASGKTEAFMELYSQILDHAGPSYGAIMRHIRDHPDQPCLFHCTAGKDRTGLIAAIILKLAGVDDGDIAHDYALTRIGREPAREKIMARLSKEPLFQSNNEAALNMFTCRHETMLAFLQHVEKHYGGVESYLRRYLDLSDEDISIIRKNILTSNTASL